MKIKSVVALFTLLCIISLVIDACTMPDTHPIAPPTSQPNPAGGIDMYEPFNGSIYSAGDSIDLSAIIKLDVAQPLQISDSSFLVNGVPVAATTETEIGNRTGISNGAWTASDPGEYYIQGKVTLSDGSTAISEPHRICVTSIRVSAPSDWSNGIGYLGPCPLATRVSNTQESHDLTINVVAAPNVIRFAYPCNQPEAPLTFIAHVVDPQDLVALVRVIILNPGGGRPLWDLYLNWITTRPTNQKEYRGTIQSPSDFLHGIDSAHWQAIAYGRDGGQLQMVEGVIPVQPIECNLQPQPGIAPPTLTPTPIALVIVTLPPIAPLTFTLKKNAFCRKGPDVAFSDISAITAGETVDILNVSEDGFWYFVDWQKFKAKCWVAKGTGTVNGDVTGLKVLVGPSLPTPKPAAPSGPKPVLPPACASYSDASSCTTSGCSWDKSTSSCK